MAHTFGKPDKALTYPDIRKYLHYFRNNLRIVIELEKHCTRSFSNTTIQQRYQVSRIDYYSIGTTHDAPCAVCGNTRCYSHITSTGVRSIATDVTVQHGLEFQILGQNETFWSMYIRLQKLQLMLSHDGFRAHPSCGMHYHILTAQDMELPTIIHENFYQLTRKYMDVLLWITGATKRTMVRGDLQQHANPIQLETPLLRPILEISREFRGRYVGINLTLQQYAPNGNANGFHMELRFIDSNDVPVAQTAFKCLFEAMVYKSVELSEFGVLKTGTDSEWVMTKNVINRILNNNLTSDDITYLKSKGKELISLLKNQLVSFDGESVTVLSKLVEKPIHQWLNTRKTPKQIDKILLPRENRQSAMMKAMREIITLQKVTANTAKQWRKEVAQQIGTSEGTVAVYLTRMGNRGIHTTFDKEIGSYIIIY